MKVHAVLHREYAVLVLTSCVDELDTVVLRVDTSDLGECLQNRKHNNNEVHPNIKIN